MLENLVKGPLFARLDRQQLLRVAQHAAHLELREGERLFEQGEPAQRFYLLLAGQIKLFALSPNGREKVIEIVTPFQTFGEALMFLDKPEYPVGAEALQPAELISIDARDFADMLRGSIDTCFLLLGTLSKHLRSMVLEIENLSLNSATCRVARYLMMQATGDRDELDLNIPKQILASRLSIKPETLSRITRNLCDRRILEIRGGHVHILDRKQLDAIATACLQPDPPSEFHPERISQPMFDMHR